MGMEQELRQFEEEKRGRVTEAGNNKIEEVDSEISVKESGLGGKARAADDMLTRMGDHCE